MSPPAPVPPLPVVPPVPAPVAPPDPVDMVTDMHSQRPIGLALMHELGQINPSEQSSVI
jgi:hypothetical protein